MSSWTRLRILPRSGLFYMRPLLATLLPVLLLLPINRTHAQAHRITFNTVEDRTTTGSIAHECGFTAIVWMQEQAGPGWNLMWLENEGLSLTPPLPVESAVHEDYAPRTMAARGETWWDIHAVWQRQTGTGAEIMHGAHPFGQSWSVEPITVNSTEDLSPDIASRFDGRLHVTWVGLDPKSGEGKIFYGRKEVSPPGPWTVELLTESDLGLFWSGAAPKIEISEHNNIVHIVYRGGDLGYHTHYARRDAGGVWSYQVLTSPNGEDLVADVATASPFLVNSVTVAMSGNNCFGCQSRVYVRKSPNLGLGFGAATLQSSFHSAELGALAAGSLSDDLVISAELSGNIYTGNLFLADFPLPPENRASFSPSMAQVTCIGLHEGLPYLGTGIAFTNHGSQGAPPDSAEVWAIRGVDPGIAVEDPPLAPRAELAVTASPNPFSSSTVITATSLLPESKVELNIYDSLGRLIRRFSDGSPNASQSRSWHWDGRDATGRPAPSGIFFLETKQGSARAIDRLIRIR